MTAAKIAWTVDFIFGIQIRATAMLTRLYQLTSITPLRERGVTGRHAVIFPKYHDTSGPAVLIAFNFRNGAEIAR